ncbi:MAG TPA: ABC transporter permease [Terriglobales bacterium]|nr:ABC transporter permease [Terriglobales bacterium]
MNSATQVRSLEAASPPFRLPGLHISGPPTVTIRAGKGWQSLAFHELWDYRELLFFLTWRDIKVRYKQTVLGVAWAIIQPFFGMVVFTIFFGRLAKVPSDGIPYPLFCYAALLPWQLFAYALTESSNSVVTNERLITKVYFPRLVIPISAVLAGLVDFVIAFGVLLVMMAYYGVRPGWAVLTLPLFVLFAVATALGVGLWLSALNVRYRDVRYTLPFITQLWLFASPVAYSSSLVPERWRPLYGLNPMTGVVEGFRWALLGRTTPPGMMVLVSGVVVVVVLLSGLFYFRRVERSFADLV